MQRGPRGADRRRFGRRRRREVSGAPASRQVARARACGAEAAASHALPISELAPPRQRAGGGQVRAEARGGPSGRSAQNLPPLRSQPSCSPDNLNLRRFPLGGFLRDEKRGRRELFSASENGLFPEKWRRPIFLTKPKDSRRREFRRRRSARAGFRARASGPAWRARAETGLAHDRQPGRGWMARRAGRGRLARALTGARRGGAADWAAARRGRRHMPRRRRDLRSSNPSARSGAAGSTRSRAGGRGRRGAAAADGRLGSGAVWWRRGGRRRGRAHGT